ncbi:peptidoglycan bridge formation glycyltransferase FemA/FemB family protein [Candidatus Uhrbacteria bacterium]|nr:peptidoglycan bridge formation glycyltransferase FemA/FemB family protein [Candidatus Uhrbacteria bacterium]
MLDIALIESREIWDAFLGRARPNTFLHSWEWGEFQQGMGERVWRLGIYSTNGDESNTPRMATNLVGIALVIKVKARRGSFLFCPHGPIFSRSTQHVSRNTIVQTLCDYLTDIAKTEKCSFVRFSPLMLKTPVHEMVWQKLGFREAPIHMHPELAWILDITPSESELLTDMRKTTRYSIRKAEKDGVEIVKSISLDDIEKFWTVYQSTVERQRFVPFSKNYLSKEFRTFAAQNKAMLIFGMYKGEIISTAFVVFEKWSGFYHHGASIPKYASIPASQLVQWHAILEAKKRDCVRYNFWGIVPESAKTHPWAGLTLFKKGFGGYAQEYVHAQDLIISSKYWVNWMVERLRKWRRHL